MPCLVDKLSVARDRVDLCTSSLELVIVVSKILKLSWADKGKVSWIEEEQAPLTQCGLFAYLSDFTVVECVYLKITNLLTNKRHSQFLSVSKTTYKTCYLEVYSL